jgi:nitrate reductase gamma subunit
VGYFNLVIPAKAGIQKFDERNWVPAFAGTTELAQVEKTAQRFPTILAAAKPPVAYNFTIIGLRLPALRRLKPCPSRFITQGADMMILSILILVPLVSVLFTLFLNKFKNKKIKYIVPVCFFAGITICAI